MKLTKLFGLAAIVLSANMANATTYQVYTNQYGGTTTSIIDLNVYSHYDGCSTVYSSSKKCTDRYVYNDEVYESYADAITATKAHQIALDAAYEAADNILPIYTKIDEFIDDYEITNAHLEALDIYQPALKAARFAELKANTEWYVVDKVTGNHNSFDGTYDEFLSAVASEQTSELDRIHYQVNLGTGDARIKLVNYDNTYFTEDWIYTNFYQSPETYVSDLIVGLAEESFQQGYKTGWHDGYNEGYDQGYLDGYIDGYKDGVASTQ